MIPVLDETVRLAELRDAERSACRSSGRFKLAPAERELLSYLECLPAQDARRLLSLMYFGRGDDVDLLRLEKTLIHDAEGAVFSMFEKSPLAKYLRAGVTRAGDAGVDLEAWWAHSA